MFSLFMKKNCDGGMKNKTRVKSNLRGMNRLIYEKRTGWMEDEWHALSQAPQPKLWLRYYRTSRSAAGHSSHLVSGLFSTFSVWSSYDAAEMLLLVAMTTRSTRVAPKLWNRRQTWTSRRSNLSPLRMQKLLLSLGTRQQFSFHWWCGNGQRKKLFQPARFSFFISACHCTGR